MARKMPVMNNGMKGIFRLVVFFYYGIKPKYFPQVYLLYSVDATCTKNISAKNDNAENASAENASAENGSAENTSAENASHWHIPYINPYPLKCIHGESDIQINIKEEDGVQAQ